MGSLAVVTVASLMVLVGGSSATSYPLRIVQIPNGKTSIQQQVAVGICVGLANRDESVAGPVFSVVDAGRDPLWFKSLYGSELPAAVDSAEFVKDCLKGSSDGRPALAKGYILYDYAAQKVVLPNLITLAAVLDAVLLETGDPAVAASGAKLVFDAATRFKGYTARQATSFMYDNYVNMTTGLAKMNPGLDVHGPHKLNPPLTGQISAGLVDYIVKERLFNMFLNLGCVPFTEDHQLMEKIATRNPWPRPLVVMGYDDTIAVAGDLFEAETNCVKERNMGQVASEGVNNLAYWSRNGPVTEPLLQNPPLPSTPTAYNASHTYIALIVGDGDNVAFMKGSRFDWFQDRMRRCAKSAAPGDKDCFPLVWSMSPALLRLAPDMIRWYYNMSYTTKADYFVLPPSGDTYSYPGEMHGQDQANFVANTERDSAMMNTSGTVSWEFTLTWPKAIKSYFPRYSAKAITRGFFAVNVPFVLPILAFHNGEFYKVLGSDGDDDKGSSSSSSPKKVVLFRPREWRGSGKSTEPFGQKQMLNATDMAKEVNGYPRGTVTAIYLTSDGGATLDQFYDLVKDLDPHVKVVDHNTVVKMALAQSGEQW